MSRNGKSITISNGTRKSRPGVRPPDQRVQSSRYPGQKVSSLYVNNDDSLQKVLTAVRSSSLPDIAYLYGFLEHLTWRRFRRFRR